MEEKKTFDWETVRQRLASVQAALAEGSESSIERMEHVLAERAAQLAQVPEQEDKGARVEVVPVQLGGEVYGLEVPYVFTVLPAVKITPVPHVPDWVVGVFNLRGRILSAVDLRRFLDLPRVDEAQENGATPCFLVVKASEMEVALLVEEVLAVEPLPVSRMRESVDAARGLPAEYVHGVFEREDRDGAMMVVLNLAALLSDERLRVHEDVI